VFFGWTQWETKHLLHILVVCCNRKNLKMLSGDGHEQNRKTKDQIRFCTKN
jgi:hypothetical protein